MSTGAELISKLDLKPLQLEGGFFKVIYISNRSTDIGEQISRNVCSSIYYALTEESPFNFFHKVQSDIVHYFLRGSPIKYTVVSPEGECTTTVLGPNLQQGHLFHLVVPKDHWKLGELQLDSGGQDFGLICEAVCPGFDYDDRTMATLEDLKAFCPNNWQHLSHGISGVTD